MSQIRLTQNGAPNLPDCGHPGPLLPQTLGWEAWTVAAQARHQTEVRAAALREETTPAQTALLKAHPFLLNARADQVPPAGDWRTWLFLGGRGAGKTRAGAELVNFAVRQMGYSRVALVGPALHDVREVMLEGESGLMKLPGVDVNGAPVPCPKYEPSRRRVVWENGAEAYVFSAEDPDSLRGPQFDLAWCDEIGAWARGQQVWDTLQMGLRLGADPRLVATTTPRPVPLVRGLVGAAGVAVSQAATAANAHNLSPGFVAQMEARYGGTALGRQELLGELLDDPEGAMFARTQIDAARVWQAPEQFEDVVVAVDPPATSGPYADACGIVAAGQFEGRSYVLGDASAGGLAPLDWARAAVGLARDVGASRIIAEANQGGEMVRQTLETAGCDLPVRLVHARLGKRGRAAPVAAAYAQGMVAHVGSFGALEDELCQFGAAGFTRSPDRVDALVWAIWALREVGAGPRVRVL